MRTKHQTFVVQLEHLGADEHRGPERLCGSVESLGSGARTHFRSARALLSFLRRAQQAAGSSPRPARRPASITVESDAPKEFRK